MKISKILIFVGKFGGIITLILFWSFTFLSMFHNPSFSIFHGALSDLGSPEAHKSWLYNYGLILSSPFLFLFSIYLIFIARNKAQSVGGAFILMSSIFLAFIGIFHSGTEPHGFVSTYFFLQFFFGMLIFSIGSERRILIMGVILFITALIGAFFSWPSTAILEIYEIAVISIFVISIPLFNLEISESKAQIH